jgi:hypothetical protein
VRKVMNHGRLEIACYDQHSPPMGDQIPRNGFNPYGGSLGKTRRACVHTGVLSDCMCDPGDILRSRPKPVIGAASSYSRRGLDDVQPVQV